MQYEKHHDGSLTPLKQKNVDTGWGLERILAFLNGTRDVYQIDLFSPVIAYIEKVSGKKYEQDETLTRSMRILADHVRTSVMLVGDEAKLLPSNVGAGYVLRRLIRRAVRHGRTLGLHVENIIKIAEIFIDDVYAQSYPLLKENKEFVVTELKKEINRFESTLENGMKEFRKIMEQKKKEGLSEIDGKSAFYLYDTFGFPIELTVEMAQEEGVKVDEEGFAAAMEEQKQKARENQNFSAKLSVENSGLYGSLDAAVVSEYVGYDTLEETSGIVAMNNGNEWKESLSEGEEGTVITAKTPFYATMGGQCADTGIIVCGESEFQVEDTVKLPGDRIGHVGKVVKGSLKTGDVATLKVNEANHSDTCKNHSATHLLQKALQSVLGGHVEQAGSFVNGDRLRFDFSHSSAMTKEEICRVEKLVNEKIGESLAVVTKVMSIEEAKKTGAMALFGEKYGETVRVVRMGDFSTELCGGTHVANTAEIRLFKILSESGVAAGVRRIEAITGDGVLKYYDELETRLQEAAETVKTTPLELVPRLSHLMAELKALQSENESLKSKAAKDALGNVMDQVVEVKGVKLLAAKVSGVDMNGLRDLGDQLKAKLPEGVVVLISDVEGKVNMVAMATDGAMHKGAHAGNLIKGIAALVGGGGGGRPNMAQAGGKNPAGINDAIAKAQEVLEAQIA